jgi:succinate dehydrogenase / fumarate reductase flavoprotein subunit
MKLIRGYPEYMRELIEKVEQTRERRAREVFKPMSMEEREEILRKYHPDYIKEAKRVLRIGPNKGDLLPNEVADLLEAYPVIKARDIDLAHIDYDSDILIIGGGGAGLVAALWACYSGIKPEDILIVQKLRLGDSNSIMSQGGVQAATKPNDSPLIHYLDAIGGGHFTNKPELVRALVSDGPMLIKWLAELGVIFDRDSKGDLLGIHGGGTSRKRMLSCKDYTGMEIVRVLRDEVRNLEIPILEFTSAVELILDDFGQAAGAVLYNMETTQYYIARAKATILATGGFGRLHIQNFPTTNHYGATADGLVMAYHAGAKLRDMDAVQYHPTGAAYPEQIVGQLITEKVRGLGAQPVNKHGEMFVYPLEPRDVESAAIIRECYGRDNGIVTPTGLRGVWLDSPLIELIHGEGTIQRELSAMYRQYKRFDIDMSKDPILTFPTLHYQNGGVEIDEYSQTNIKGLFAAGEVTGGVHGKNRLMGNSILDYCVFGRRAGIYAAKHAKNAKIGKLTLAHLEHYEIMLGEAGIVTARKAPILLPEYRGREVLSRALDIF